MKILLNMPDFEVVEIKSKPYAADTKKGRRMKSRLRNQRMRTKRLITFHFYVHI